MALKAGVFSLTLAFAAATGFSPLAVVVFAIAAAAVYLVPIFRTFSHPISFALLAVLAGVLGSQLMGAGEYLPFIAAVGVLAYLILSLKGLHLVERASWHYLAVLAMGNLLALTFFSADHSRAFTLQLVLTTVATFLLWREFFRNSVPAGIAALLAAEFLWIVATLPLTIINSTNLAVLVLFSATDLLRRSSAGVSVRSALAHLTVAVSVTIAIFFIAAFS